MAIVFEVEHAGCESCAAKVSKALADLGPVAAISIDEAADSATVTLARDSSATEDRINTALADASHGSGHAYRVRAGSWRAGV
ncbi:MAG: heavy-metal-associated domain-containing protein [Actinobacteria bacterium]|nr:heavy-metal-associated domain-containing protein [Actinomycetota bacterium]